MTRQQIVKMASKTGHLVASNKVGAALPSAKQIARYNALKAAAAAQRQAAAVQSGAIVFTTGGAKRRVG